MHLQLLKFTIIIFFSLHSLSAPGQSAGITAIEKAISEKKYNSADAVLQSLISVYFAERKPDSLANYVLYVGKVAQGQTDVEQAVQKLQEFINKIKTLSPSPAALRQTYINGGEYYGFAGKNSLAYSANGQAMKYTLLIPAKTKTQLGQVENNLSTYAQRVGKLDLAQWHAIRAVQNFEADPHPDYEGLYIAYNGMGSAMWYISKIDSGIYYYSKAHTVLEKAPRTLLNQYFRPALLQNNLSGLYGVQGKTTEAIRALKLCISKYKKFLSSKEPHPKKAIAARFHLEAIDNLAGIYKELGDFQQARELLEYSYREKQKQGGESNPAIFISQILLGQLYFSIKDFKQSLEFLNSGLTMISKADGDYLVWQADACSTLAMLYDEKDNKQQAAIFYEKADSLYEESLQGEYDNVYLEFLSNAALFYAAQGQKKIALAKANKGYDYVVKTKGAKTLLAFYQLLNISEVNFLCGRFVEALSYSKKGLQVVNNNIRSSSTLLDSIKTELQKPKAILLKSKAEYQLLVKKDVAGLTNILKELEEALSILDRKKTLFSDPGNINLLIAEHSALLDFIKKITSELYNLTNDPGYMDRVLSLHESGIYNRIRLRLDKNDSLHYGNIPDGVQLKERQLKAAIITSLQEDGTSSDKMERYFKAIENRDLYLQTLKSAHPQYYKMRYASIFKSAGEIQHLIPAGTTLIRYFFIEKELFALTADNKGKQVVPLGVADLEKEITAVSLYEADEQKTSAILHSLYGKLWLPLTSNIHNKKVIIIPDGILYNLNFEILTPQKITSYKELSTKSLVAKHIISYQYSLFLLDKESNIRAGDKNFIAFAPGFSDKIKESYKRSIKDSGELDNNYLSLLPQPFTLSLAGKMKDLFSGSAFLNDESTESSFKANAGHHKIIHIGTHAEANNLNPEFSRLIFAKDATQKQKKNSLYLFDIYQCDLTSSLTIITACESGRPGYQDGEGMISLAHAFNYAGSESIITALWKIDEQSSALIMDNFYKNLLKGMPKDEALQQAKLTYLANSRGRSLSPQYWAGLVLIGDTTAIEIETTPKKNWVFILPLALLLLIPAYFITRKRRDYSISKK